MRRWYQTILRVNSQVIAITIIVESKWMNILLDGIGVMSIELTSLNYTSGCNHRREGSGWTILAQETS